MPESIEPNERSAFGKNLRIIAVPCHQLRNPVTDCRVQPPDLDPAASQFHHVRLVLHYRHKSLLVLMRRFLDCFCLFYHIYCTLFIIYQIYHILFVIAVYNKTTATPVILRKMSLVADRVEPACMALALFTRA